MLQGRPGAAAESLFAPYNLSPEESKEIHDYLLPKDKPQNPILKTIIDVSTNPLVIIGALLAYKFPVGKATSMERVFEGLAGTSKKISEAMSYLAPAHMNLRNIPNLYHLFLDHSRNVAMFTEKHMATLHKLIQDHVALNGKITGEQSDLIAAWNNGMHKAKNSVQRAYNLTEAPILPGLEAKMGEPLVKLANGMKTWYDQVWNDWTPSKMEIAIRELKVKGVHIGRFLDDYFPHMPSGSGLEQTILESYGLQRAREAMMREVAPIAIAGSKKARMNRAIPSLESLVNYERMGIMRPGFMQELHNKMITDANTLADAIWYDVSHLDEKATEMLRKKNLTAEEGNVRKHALLSKQLQRHLKAIQQNLEGKLGLELGNEAAHKFAGDLIYLKMNHPERLQEKVLQLAGQLATPQTYSMNAIDVASRYLHSTAQTWSWWDGGATKKVIEGKVMPSIAQAYKDIMTLHGPGMSPWQRHYIQEELVPAIRGFKSWREFQLSAMFNEKKRQVFEFLQTSKVAQKVLPEQVRNYLLDATAASRGSLSLSSTNSALNKYFYLTALGANPGPISMNALQPILTLLPMKGVGPEGFARGVNEYSKRIGEFWKVATSKGGTFEKAYNTAFSDFVEATGRTYGSVANMMRSGLVEEPSGVMPRVVRKGIDKIEEVMLGPFGASEMNNWLVSFYSAKTKYLHDEGVPMFRSLKTLAEKRGTPLRVLQIAAKSHQFGEDITRSTQFGGGPLGTPRALLGVPGPLKQFAHFPMNEAAYLSGSLGFGENPGVRDWGTIGRALGISAGVAVAAKDMLGMDLSRGLITGALPAPSYEGSPFYPWPIVPPAVGLAGNAVMSVAQGSLDPLRKSWGIMVPGGVVARRLMQNVSPSRADYKNRTPDGRIPVYNKDGALVGTYSPWELTMKAMGLNPASVTAEQQATQYIVSQRDKIRGYRKKYLDAFMKNDVRQSEIINAEFQKAYPGFGPIQVTKADLKALDTRRQVSRINRVMQGVPAQYRPMFQQMVNESSFRDISQNIQAGASPEVFQ
jgi:hypothetical protein